MINVTLYRRQDCPECDQVENDLNSLKDQFPHNLVKVDIEADAALSEKFSGQIPFVQVGPYKLNGQISRQDLQVALGAANDRQVYLEKTDEEFQRRQARGRTVSGTDRFSLWVSNHYMWVFNFFVFLYIGMPFLAPVLMKARVDAPAKIIYTIYSPLCHQLAFRSFFLFGEQPYYPRSLANISGVVTYEELTGNPKIDLLQARSFIGNDVTGYKVSICERDVAIYGSLLLFGIIFAITGRKIKSLPWYFWIVVGLIPIGVDGVSQLPGLAGWSFLSWLPIRESTPFLRVLTGALFGGTTAWYLYPLIEESMRETHVMLIRKVAVVNQTQNKS
jgi:uncharacterized membrane protein